MLFEDFSREDTHKEKLFFSGRTTNRRGGNPLTPLTNKQKPTFFSMIKKITKKNDKKMHVMFSAGQYRSIMYDNNKVSKDIIFSDLNLTKICLKK